MHLISLIPKDISVVFAACVLHDEHQEKGSSCQHPEGAKGEKRRVFPAAGYVRSVVELLTFLLWIPVPLEGGCSSYSVRPCSCFLEKCFN